MELTSPGACNGEGDWWLRQWGIRREGQLAQWQEHLHLGRQLLSNGLVKGYRSSACHMVYDGCMSRTNIDIDEEACRVVMERYQLSTKREAVNFALRTVAGEPLSLEKARRLRGSGWEGDLDQMRTHRAG
jgi:Arc/MetJ family transcription regulator